MTIHSTHNSQTRVAESGKFKKQLTLTDLTFIGLGAIFGSGWLFAASHVASIAGPAGIASWVIGGFAVLLLGIVYCELGAALPRAGGIIRYPVFSHGELMGYLLGFITLIAFSSLISIEIVAARQYAAAWFPALTQPGSSSPTLLGWVVQFLLLCFFFALNYYSVKTFARSNNFISVLKFLVPLLVVVTLFAFFKPENLHAQGIAPFGMSGVEAAISAGGIIFAYLGLTPIISVASEVQKPQRTIPIALILSVVLSTIIYVLLQLAFLGSIPTEMLNGGWAEVSKQFSLPYRDIAITLGMGWLAFMVISDAIISPSGTGNIYMNATPRVIYGWAKAGTFFKAFTHIDKASGIPRPALWLTFGLSIFWTRPFRVRAFGIIGPVSFMISALIVYWSGWNTLSWLLGLQIVMFVVYVMCKGKVPEHTVSLAQQVKSSLWLIVFYALIILFSWLGSFGGLNVIGHPWDTVLVAAMSLGIYYWGARSCLPQANFSGDEEE
ncbi:APC family permease [Klebsiella aerogenes]